LLYRSKAAGRATQERYEYNAKEMDEEFGITGESYTTNFREHNPFIGSWWSVDTKPTPSEEW
jgi:hypothetical protein